MTRALSIVGMALLFSIPVTGLSLRTNDTEKIKITIHVTSVSTAQIDEPSCDPDQCSVTRFTVEGYAENQQKGTRTKYVLTCDEYLVPKPTPHVGLACSKVHADHDYEGSLSGASINFWPEEKYTPPPMREVYSIVSEKSVRK